MKARIEIEAADLHAFTATGNHLDDPVRWQVYCGTDRYVTDTYMYITAEDARKASEAFFDLACRLDELDAVEALNAASSVVAA